MTRALPLLAVVGTLSALSLALAGCASNDADPSATPPAGQVMDVDAAWLDAGRLIGVVTWGSSTCVPQEGEATLAGDGSIEVVLVDPAETDPERPCTEDLRPRVTVVGVPLGVDAAAGAEITVSLGAASGSASLPALAGAAEPGGSTDYQPSAGWTTTPGTLAYVTWGSSTCVPAVQDVAVTGDAQVTVTFQEPEPDRICTMDMVPRAGILEVGEIPAPAGAQLVLTGDTFDNVTVPILGG